MKEVTEGIKENAFRENSGGVSLYQAVSNPVLLLSNVSVDYSPCSWNYV